MSAEYTQYIVEHKANVEKAYRWIQDHNIFEDCEFPVHILEHDLSKYGAEEYSAYDNYFYGKKTEDVKRDFDYAWLHHIHNNPHHWQYWVLINDEDGTKALEMPEEYALEMVCDWWAFSHKSGNLKEIFDWYKSHKKNMILHEKTRKFVEDLLDKIKKALEEEENGISR
jgi:hypothetical protein